jgi:hypothetical protein
MKSNELINPVGCCKFCNQEECSTTSWIRHKPTTRNQAKRNQAIYLPCISNEKVQKLFRSRRTKKNIVAVGKLPPNSRTLCHYLGRPHVEAIHDLANIRNGFQRRREYCICLGIIKNDEASSTLIKSSCKLLIQNHLR